MAWLCIFAPQHFIDFYSKQAQSLLRAFPWGGRPFYPLGEGKNPTVWGASARVHIVGACVDSGWGRLS